MKSKGNTECMFDFTHISPLRIMLIDDHLVFSQGMAALLGKLTPDCDVSIFTSVQKAMQALETGTYQFVICDLFIPGSNVKDFIAVCRKNFPESHLIMLSDNMETNITRDLFARGAHACLSKTVTSNELKTALGKAYLGERFVSSDLKSKTATSFSAARNTELTKKEFEVLQLIVAGKSVAQTSETLFISRATVMSHRRNIMSKLDLHTAAELVKFAFENNLVRK